MPATPAVAISPRERAIRERRVRGRIEDALSAVAGWLLAIGEHKRPASQPLLREQVAQLNWLLDTAEAAVSRVMGAGWRARFAPRDSITWGEVQLALILAFKALETVAKGFEARQRAEHTARPKHRRRVRYGRETFGPHHPLPLIPEPPPEPEPEPVAARWRPAPQPQPETHPTRSSDPRASFRGLAGQPIDMAEQHRRSILGF